MELLVIKKGPKIQSYIKKKSEIYLSVTSSDIGPKTRIGRLLCTTKSSRNCSSFCLIALILQHHHA